MDIMQSIRPLEVDSRISLRYYLRVADNLLQQANVFRDEKKIVDMYVMLLRFSSLIAESIPLHQDYNGLDQDTRRDYKKKLLSALKELDELKPKVKQEIDKLNKNAANKHSKPKAPRHSEASSSESPVAMTSEVTSNFNAKQTVWHTHPLQKGPFISSTAQHSAEDVGAPKQNIARISMCIGERVPHPDSHPRIRPWGSYRCGDQKSQGASSSGNKIQNSFPWNNMNSPATETLTEDPICAPMPSAPPIENLTLDDASTEFPSINSHSNDSCVAMEESPPVSTDERRGNILSASTCTICMDAPVEGACVPCGHMAGCMTCLNEIKEKSWGCPICRVKIEMVLRLFAV